MKTLQLCLFAVLLVTCFFSGPALLAEPAHLSEKGKALVPVTVAADASQSVKDTAATLAEYLGRVSGGEFKVQTGDGTSGIVLGTAEQLPALKMQGKFNPKDPKGRETYILRSHDNGVYLVGATELAVQNAVWDFLHRLGYRQFFPGAHWEVVPSTPDLTIDVDVKEQPDYYSRRIWFTYNTWPANVKRMAAWSRKNRMVSGFDINAGHAYQGIIKRNLKEFEAHPEYLTKPADDLLRDGHKFCVSNPGLRRLVINDALKYFEDNPQADSYSVDPSDGGGWASDSCPDAQEIGSPSNRVLTLANVVAEAVEKKFPGKYVGFYAYNYHSPPPTIKVHPNVVALVATAFRKGGYSVDELMGGWSKQGATLGVREYFSIIHWDKDLPNHARASKPTFMAYTIPHFYNQGVRFHSAESSDNWGPHGLQYYIASRLMWDVDQATKVDDIISDFLNKSFGPARPAMEKWYGIINQIHGEKQLLFIDDYLARLFEALDEAYKLTDDPAILARLNDLTHYTHFLELYRIYQSTPNGEARLKAFETLIRHSYRIRDTHMVHSLAQYRTRFRDVSFRVPAEAHWQQPEATNPWKSSEPFTQAEIQQFVRHGLENYERAQFETQIFSKDLVPATSLSLVPVGSSTQLFYMRGAKDIFVWAEDKQPIQLTILAGAVLKDRGSTVVQLYKADTQIVADEDEAGDELVGGEAEEDAEAVPEPEVLDSVEIEAGVRQEVLLKHRGAGLYRVRIQDAMTGYTLTWNEGTKVVFPSALDAAPRIGRRWRMFFYVPKGTKNLSFFANGDSKFLTPDGKGLEQPIKHREYNSIVVPEGMDGKLWTFVGANSWPAFLNIPPYLVRSPEELLLPREVVEADSE